ncbi:MAG: IS1096 element passenger TnpR family protein [Thermomicrobiales bacterium]
MPRARFKPEPPIYTFRVRMLGGFYAPPDADKIWREIEVAANQPLAELGEAIPFAFAFDDPHLWSFFLSGEAWDSATEYGLVESQGDFMAEAAPGKATRTLIRDVPYPAKDGTGEFLFLFDFGDEWHFGVQLVRTAEAADAKAHYPRVVASDGEAPPQYPDFDEEDWDEEEDEADAD